MSSPGTTRPDPARPSGLPVRPTAPPLVVRLPRVPFPVTLSYAGPDTWTITEHLGEQHIGHGQLTHTYGIFAITTTGGGTTQYDHSWQSALVDHLHRR